MRRCLHAFLVGVLSLGLSMDTARACWYLRHAHQVVAYRASDCPAAVPCMVADDCQPWTAWPQHSDWVVVDAAMAEGCDGWVCVSDVGVVDDAWMTEGSLDGCGCAVGVVADGIEVSAGTDRSNPIVNAPVVEPLDTPVAVTSEPSVESVVVPEPVGGPDAPPVATEPPLENLKPADLPADDDVRDDVQQATALTVEPSAESESMPEEPATEVPASTPVEEAPPAVESPAEPEEPNLFEEADAVAADAATTDAAPEIPSGGDDVPPAEPGAGDAREDGTAAPAGEKAPADEPATDGSEPAAAADPFDAATRSGEPVRRWIDRTGGYAAVGALVAVREDGICVLATTECLLTVPLAALSDHDRSYVVRAEGRLATRPPVRDRDTAGL